MMAGSGRPAESEATSTRRLIALGAGIAFVILGGILAIDLVRFLPDWARARAVECAFAGVAAGYLAVGLWIRWRGIDPRSSPLGRGLNRVDLAAWWALRRGLLVGLAGLGGAWLAMWLPHYLQWPWSRDAEAFAVIAQGWDAGELPYRDVRGYNFPGQIYLHWILGKVFGWGRTWTLYAADAGAFLAYLGVLLAWARRRLGSSLAGMAACLTVLALYLDLHFEAVGERDWHAPLGGALGVLVLETWPGRRGRWLSAFLVAGAFVIRPHAVLFLPALALAAAESADEGRGWRRRAAPVLEWGCAFGLFVALGFAPLVVAGVLDDLIRGLRVASYGGPYSTFTLDRGVAILAGEFRRPTTAALLIALIALGLRSRRDPLTGPARTWLLVVAGTLLYRPLHPVDHNYLTLPLALTSATAWAIPFAWCVRAATETPAGRRRPLLGLLAILLLLYETSPIAPRWFPWNCGVEPSLAAIRAAVRGGPTPAPPGASIWYGPSKRQPFYTWDDYTQLLRYIRETTGPETIVANVLKNPPFPTVNGPTGRRSPFHAETGIAWVWLVREDMDETFARELEEAGADSIVVWAPREYTGQPRLRLERLGRVILDEYVPEARFGLIEVWRRKPTGGAEPPARAGRGGPPC